MPICFALLSPSCYPWMEAWLTGQCAWREELYVHVYNGCQGKCVNEESLQEMCHNVEQINGIDLHFYFFIFYFFYVSTYGASRLAWRGLMVWPSPLTIVKTSLMRHNYIYPTVLRSAVTKYRRFILGDLLFKCCRCLKVKESQTSHRTDNKYEYNT